MIIFQQLTFKNFLSYGAVPTTIDLERPGAFLVTGEDLDNTENGTMSNGTGKTVILNALIYGLFDKPISDIASKDLLINNINKKDMEVSISFKIDSNHYKITRRRKSKSGAAGNTVELTENGKDITPDSIGNTNKQIVDILGLQYDLFIRIVTFSTSYEAFLDLPVRSHYAANQTGIIEELFNLKLLSIKAEALKDQIKETDTSIQFQSITIANQEQEQKRIKNQIDSIKQKVADWDKTKTLELRQIDEQLNLITDVDINEQESLLKLSKTIQKSIDGVGQQLITTEKKYKSTLSQLGKISNEITHLKDNTCPYCSQTYQDSIHKLELTSNRELDLKDSLVQISKKLEVLSEEYDNLAINLQKNNSLITIPNIEEVIEANNKKSLLEQRRNDLLATENPISETLSELQTTSNTVVDKSKLNDLIEIANHQKFLLKLLTKKDSFVRKALLNNNLPFLNERLEYHLNLLGLNHTVEFTHEMTARISQFGRELNFGNLSTGQRAKVNIALAFSFRDVLQRLHRPINLCMLDEVLDVGLDSVGVQAAAKMLKNKARDENLSIYIITHRTEIDSLFDKSVKVQMKQGFSTINE